jgi:hypothetical protein
MIPNMLGGRFLALLVAAGVVCALAPAAARAALDGYFCGNPDHRTYLQAGARCAHPVQHLLSRVSAHESNPSPSNLMCSLGKQTSSGGGVNVTPAICVQPYYSGNSDSYCTTGYTCIGYATIILQDGPPDTFYGHLWAVW